MARKKSWLKKFLRKFKYFPGEPAFGFEGTHLGVYVRWPNSLRAFLVPGIGFSIADDYVSLELLYLQIVYFRREL